MTSTHFNLQAGALCLDYANTMDWHASDSPVEQLSCYADLAHWAEAAGILSSSRADRLRQFAQSQLPRAAQAYARAIQLRESIYRIFSTLANQGEANPGDLTILNQALSTSLSHLHIIHSSTGFVWDWIAESDDLDQIVWSVARSAGELLASDQLNRTRQCADDRGCGYLFIDASRNRSRRWCSMESCGNRAKARRHYQNR